MCVSFISIDAVYVHVVDVRLCELLVCAQSGLTSEILHTCACHIILPVSGLRLTDEAFPLLCWECVVGCITFVCLLSSVRFGDIF